MRLLSRHAESLFWLARYLERAASLARVIEMQGSFGGHGQNGGWATLLALYSDEQRFLESHEATAANIIAFYVTDVGNPGSIRSSIRAARENARSLRSFVPLEMWVQLNDFYGKVEALSAADIEPSQLSRTCSQLTDGCLAQLGIAEGTLYRDEGYLFHRLGLLVERADQTSRLLDVKFAQGDAIASSIDPANDFVFWSTILRTAAAYRVFQRLEPDPPNPERVARFLILNSSHPRSIGYCVREIGGTLERLRTTFRLPHVGAAQETCEILMEGLQAAGRDAALARHLHDFNDAVQRRLSTLTNEIGAAFFRPPAVDTGIASGAGGLASGTPTSDSSGDAQSQKQS